MVLPLMANAQQRFDASLFAGLNMGQIDGDASGRYNHPGLRAGVGTSFPLGEDLKSPWRMVVEMAFTNKGAHVPEEDIQYSLSYIEVPLMMSYTCMHQSLRIAAGIAPAVMVGVSVTDDGDEDENAETYFKRLDLLPLTLSVRYMLGLHLGAEFRMQYSALSIADELIGQTYFLFRDNRGCFNNVVTFGLTYVF